MTTWRFPTGAALAAALILVPLGRGTAADLDDAPDIKELTKVLQQRLDTEFHQGLFEVRSLRRQGVYPHEVARDDRERILVYYDAELRFQRDYRLAEWDALNVRSLVWLLGATPGSVQGVRARGNATGDVLQVSGALYFAREQGKKKRKRGSWIAIAADVARPPEVDAAEAGAGKPYRERQLLRLAEIGEQLERDGDEETQTRLQREIDHVINDIEGRLAGRRGVMRLATGTPTGEYHALGQGIAAQMNAGGPVVFPLRTAGSAANCRMVQNGEVEAALTQNDVAYMAFHGKDLFQGALPMDHLRALCAVSPEAIQVVTLASSGIRSIEELRGRSVDLGPDDSGTRFNAVQVLATADLTVGDLGAVQGSSFGDALDDLSAGRVDAVFITGAYPYAEIAAHAAHAPIRLLGLTRQQVDAMFASAPFMLPVTIPAHTYPGQDEPVNTVGVTALLVARDDLPDDGVRALLEALLSEDSAITRYTVQGYFVTRESANRGLSIPLHPAARRFLGGGGEPAAE